MCVLSEEYRLDSFHDAANKFGHLLEMWNNRFTFQGQSIVEQYQQARLTLVCDLDIRVADARMNRRPIVDDDPIPNSNLLASVVFRQNAVHRSDLHEWKQKPVFVSNVEVVEGPEGVIPSLVGFYDIHDEVSDLFGGLLYQSTIDCAYHTIPGFSKRESSVVVVAAKPSENDFVDRKIQSAFEVVESIPDDKSKVIWKGLSGIDLHDIVSELAVRMDAESVRVHSKCNDHLVKIVDVMLGPFDL
jgi:hypothetical protein